MEKLDDEQQQQEEEEDLASAVAMPTAGILLLPDVFRRVSPRGLAASRCVCGAWRALIDDRRLLRADLLPLSLAGLLLCLEVESELPELFVCPGAADVAAGYLMPIGIYMVDHCAGLVLINHTVLNPATGQEVCLPPVPEPLWDDERNCFVEDCYLAFDPAASPH